ncbi:MAG: hypothetical protein JNM18_23370 [Planctomycetaceae bacterium]|nr:hypothetical protein [Planctomycetaceae bacterium]
MNGTSLRIITLAIVLGFAQIVAGQNTNPVAAALGPEDGVVFLTNGQALVGKVTRAGDYLYVVVPNGEIRLRRQEVELFCRSFDEGYQLKKAAVPRGEITGHLDLADWCVRHHLYGYAAEQLVAARQLDPAHLRIGLIERRLELARERKIEESTATEAAPNGPTLEELDRMIRALPTGVVDQFANTVQPMLLNNCTATGCHGASATNGFSLMRIPIGRNASRRLTQRNLYATLEKVNRAKPSESPLVVAAIRPHGGSKTPILSGRDLVQYQYLVAWVQRLGEGAKPVAAPTAATTQLAPGAPTPVPEPRATDVLLQSARPQSAVPVANGDAATQRALDKLGSSPNGAAPTSDKQPATPSRDPFDPEVFNRRFFPDAPAAP